MTRRLLAIAALALALAPGTWVRDDFPETLVPVLNIRDVGDLPPVMTPAPLVREGVWELTSPNRQFGGFSALLYLDGKDQFRAFSDRGIRMTFDAPSNAEPRPPRFSHVWNRGRLSGTIPDIEAATRDPVTGDYWLTFENSNAILRFDRGSRLLATRQPPEWQDWPDNSGVEAMARLPDGRFLILPELRGEGLLYPGDPTKAGDPKRFAFTLPEDFFATDLAALGDGRVLILLRKTIWAIPPFSAALAIADPRTLEDGGELEIEMLANLDSILPRENYEALVALEEPRGGYTLWLMSDDNIASFQRTLLVRLHWQPAAEMPR